MNFRIKSFSQYKIFIRDNISKSISSELDLLYKWVFLWHFSENEKNTNKKSFFILFFYNFFYFFYQFIKMYRYSKSESVNKYDVVIPFLESRVEHFLLFQGSIDKIKKNGKKVVILINKNAFKDLKKTLLTKNYDFIIIENYISISALYEILKYFYKFFIKRIKVAIYLKLSIYDFFAFSLFYKKVSWDYVIYKNIFKAIHPKTSLSLSLDLHPGYVRAAKNIKKIILQHGIGPHLGMKIESNRSDVYLAWGEFSSKGIQNNYTFPFYLSSKVINVGSPRMEYLNSIYPSEAQKKNKILFISTSTRKNNLSYLSIRIMSEMVRNFNLQKKYEIIYKLHPAENISNYKEFYDSGKFADKESIYDLINESSIIIGTISTGILEALMFNKPVIQLIPKALLDSIPENLIFSKIGMLCAHDMTDLNSKIELLREDSRYLSKYLKQQKKISKFVFGDYSNASSNIARLCSK